MAEQKMTLINICDGKLEAEFERMSRDVLRQLAKGEKGKITINVELCKTMETDTIVEIGYNIKSTLPPIKRKSIGFYGDSFDVKVDYNEQQVSETLLNVFDGLEFVPITKEEK